MAKRLIALIFIILGGSLGYNYLPLFFPSEISALPWAWALVGGVVGYLLSLIFARPILKAVNRLTSWLNNQSLSSLLCGGIGLVLGLIIAWLINISLVVLSVPFVSDILPILLTIIVAYLGFAMGSSRQEEIQNILTRRQTKLDKEETNKSLLDRKAEEPFHYYKVLDTSTIIDGRILEVIRTGFLEGVFVVSTYVLQELQHIADSSDSLKRVRGRRGLDILNALQKEPSIQVEINEDEIEEAEEVDIKLLYLAKKLEGLVITNDYNLNKVAEFQSMKVLNINELAKVVKPVVIPGEPLRILIVKKGTERDQGVGYLDDGTMVVVEEGKHHINEELDVIVTSSLQTNAGRMIFAKMNDQISLEGNSLDDES